MKELKDIRDDQIRIIGEGIVRKSLPRWVWVIISVLVLVVVGVGALVVLQRTQKQAQDMATVEPTLFEPVATPKPANIERLGSEVDSLQMGYTEIIDTLVNDIPIRIFIPHNAELLLHIGKVDKTDKNIIYVAQAADVRADNGGIVGAFVLKGEPRAWGLSKRGFCASINGEITIGVADNSPLFERRPRRLDISFANTHWLAMVSWSRMSQRANQYVEQFVTDKVKYLWWRQLHPNRFTILHKRWWIWAWIRLSTLLDHRLTAGR